jgi:OOP family OmpA-OmpF porin
MTAVRTTRGAVVAALAPLLVAGTLGMAAGWSQTEPAVCHTVLDGTGQPVRDAAGGRVRTVASGPCPRAEVIAAAAADPTPLAPAAGPLATITGDVAFDFDSARIRPEFYSELDRIAAMLRANPAERLTLVGHTDAIGTEPHNQGLSERRAQAVAVYLQQAGAPGGRLITSGVGESQPVASNETPAGRARNRRVEITARQAGA